MKRFKLFFRIFCTICLLISPYQIKAESNRFEGRTPEEIALIMDLEATTDYVYDPATFVSISKEDIIFDTIDLEENLGEVAPAYISTSDLSITHVVERVSSSNDSFVFTIKADWLTLFSLAREDGLGITWSDGFILDSYTAQTYYRYLGLCNGVNGYTPFPKAGVAIGFDTHMPGGYMLDYVTLNVNVHKAQSSGEAAYTVQYAHATTAVTGMNAELSVSSSGEVAATISFSITNGAIDSQYKHGSWTY